MKGLKYITTIILLCLMVAANGITASATDKNLPDGLLIGDENGVSVNSAGDYFIYVDNLEKGDVITRTLTVRNLEPKDSFTLYLTTEPLSASGPVNWLDNLHMKITLDGRLIYTGRLRGDGIGTNMLPGNGVTMILDVLELGHYKKGDYGVIKLEFTVDADHISYWTLGEKSAAEIKWIFTAVNDILPEQPKTGEIIHYSLYVLPGILLILCIMIFIRYKRLKESSEQQVPTVPLDPDTSQDKNVNNI